MNCTENDAQEEWGKYNSRLRSITNYCKNNIILNSTSNPFSYFITHQQYKIRFCWIQKVGCAFIKTFFQHLNDYAKRHPAKELQSAKCPKTVGDNKFINIMMIRNPFERIFSAYQDKFFISNIDFWRHHGKQMVYKFRSNPSKKEIYCAHNISFSEFINYLVFLETSKTNKDGHFTPMHKHCNPCSSHFDYIWTLETINSDIRYLMETIRNRRKVDMKDFNYTYLKNIFTSSSVYAKIKHVFNKRRQIEFCIPFHEACQRLWRAFQMRGLIDRGYSMPTEIQNNPNITIDIFWNAVQKARQAFKDAIKARNQRLEALREAYNGVSTEDLRRLKTYVLDTDIKMFGYSGTPLFLFQEITSLGNFSYFKLD